MSDLHSILERHVGNTSSDISEESIIMAVSALYIGEKLQGLKESLDILRRTLSRVLGKKGNK